LKIFSYICNEIIFINVKLNKKTIMKKLFFALAMVFSFAFVGCGSKNAETETETETEVVEVETEVVSETDEVVEGDETPVVE
jgi:uncharacterized protein YcfL